MQDPGLSKARRAWIATLLVGVVLLAGYSCICLWPVTSSTIDPLETPFYGPHQANGFVHPLIYDTRGQRRAHKLIVMAAVLVVIMASFRWWESKPARRVLEMVQRVFARRRPVRRLTGSAVLLLLLAGLLAKEISSLGKTPDFSSGTYRHDGGAR
jgi:hypothetical protein